MKAVGFDFDGTLIMSEDKKGPAMATVFKEKFGVKGVKREYERLIGEGYSRDAKVIVLFEKFFKRKPTKKELKIVADHFGEHYERSMSSCPLFKCSEVVKELRSKVEYMFLLSLENEKEVRKIAKKCGIAKHFDEILGGPTSKIDHLKHVLKKYNLKRKDVVYIGDAHSDVTAARKMGIKMVLIGKHKKKEADVVVKSLCDLTFSKLLD